MVGTSAKTAIGKNPFVGPRPFEEGRRIFGRDREIEDLYNLLSAERIVLLYSPSGAGKSSLIQAGLIPRLRSSERFDVWKITRVNQPPEDQPAGVNRYLHSAMRGFEQGEIEDRRRAPEEIAKLTLADYVAARPRRPAAPNNIVLIFDQFEEILTADPLAVKAKREFFRHLGELLLAPHVWALFALREDYLAPLDPYAEQVPTHLKNGFRLDLLGRRAAHDAITNTALRGGRDEEGGREFDPAAADKLVQDLATMKVQQPDGAFLEQTGPYVEPLQLQVACRGLWEQMPPDKTRIDLNDIEDYGDVTDALSSYYQTEVARIAGGDVPTERAIREWVGDRLITPNGIRGQVLMGAGQSEGLDNKLIANLVDTHLVRGEQRDGATWYELAHDRLITPIQTNNEVWWKEQVPLLRAARLWRRNDRDRRYLYTGDQLEDILKEKELATKDPIVESFIEACSAAEEERQHEEKNRYRQSRLVSWLAVLLGGSLIPMLGLSGSVFVINKFHPAILEGKTEQLHAIGDLLSKNSRQLLLTVSFGSLLGWLLRLLYRLRNRVTQVWYKLTRKHRMDRSLQGAVDLLDNSPQFEIAMKEKRSLRYSGEASTPFDAWETRTLQFTPFWVFLAVAGADGVLQRREVRVFMHALHWRALRSNLYATYIARLLHRNPNGSVMGLVNYVFATTHHNRDRVIKEFIDDRRDTITGLEDIAAILNAKVSTEESAAFRDEIHKLGRVIAKSSRFLGTFSKISLPAEENLSFAKELLGGSSATTERLGRTRYYKHSGIYSLSGVILAIFAGVITAYFLARIYSPIQEILAEGLGKMAIEKSSEDLKIVLETILKPEVTTISSG